MKRKITVTTGTRADYGFLRPILNEIMKSKKLDLFLIVTGSHLSKKHGLTINEIINDRFKISTKIDYLPKHDTNFDMSVSLGKGIISFSKFFKKINPDINLIFGDRDEMLSSALAASHMNIPNAHLHGGDTSGGLDEYNRHAITKISNIHFPATKKSKERILKMGEQKNDVFLTGSTGVDEIFQHKITNKKDLETKYKIKLNNDLIILLQHPTTTQSKKSHSQINTTVQSLLTFNKPIIAIAPNSDAGNSDIFLSLKKYSSKYKSIKVINSMPRSDYLGMLQNCGVLVGNSSSGLIEASLLNTPVVNIGIRQQNRERLSNVVQSSGTKSSIISSVGKALSKNKKNIGSKNSVFGDGTASKKIIKVLENISLNNKLVEKQISY